MAVILGISLGSINPKIQYNNMYILTNCTINESYELYYECYYKVCNQVLPYCNDLMDKNISGKCCDSYNCASTNECLIEWGNCSKVMTIWNYNNNTINTTKYYEPNNYHKKEWVNCWFNKNNISQVIFSEKKIYWYEYYIISVMGFILISGNIGIYYYYYYLFTDTEKDQL